MSGFIIVVTIEKGVNTKRGVGRMGVWQVWWVGKLHKLHNRDERIVLEIRGNTLTGNARCLDRSSSWLPGALRVSAVVEGLVTSCTQNHSTSTSTWSANSGSAKANRCWVSSMKNEAASCQWKIWTSCSREGSESKKVEARICDFCCYKKCESTEKHVNATRTKNESNDERWKGEESKTHFTYISFSCALPGSSRDRRSTLRQRPLSRGPIVLI